MANESAPRAPATHRDPLHLKNDHPLDIPGYILRQKLASGGMATVWLAQRELSTKLCVVKQLHAHMARDQVVANRFLREAAVASELNHPGIAQLIDAGRVDDAFFLAMDFIAGQDLETIVLKLFQRGNMLPPALSMTVAQDVLHALHFAHEYRDSDGNHLAIVHRDMSPRNVMITYLGEVKIIDFGLARTNLGTFRTAPGMVLGTLRYMSPEQAVAEPVDRRSDIYSFAVVLYEMLSGRPLVRGDSPSDILRAVVTTIPAPLSHLNPALPASLDAVFAKALEKDRDARYQTALLLAQALSAAAPELCSTRSQEIGRFVSDLFPNERSQAEIWIRSAEENAEPEESTRLRGAPEFIATRAGDGPEFLPTRAGNGPEFVPTRAGDGPEFVPTRAGDGPEFLPTRTSSTKSGARSSSSREQSSEEPASDETRLTDVAPDATRVTEIASASTGHEARVFAPSGNRQLLRRPETRRAIIAAVLTAAAVAVTSLSLWSRQSPERTAPKASMLGQSAETRPIPRIVAAQAQGVSVAAGAEHPGPKTESPSNPNSPESRVLPERAEGQEGNVRRPTSATSGRRASNSDREHRNEHHGERANTGSAGKAVAAPSNPSNSGSASSPTSSLSDAKTSHAGEKAKSKPVSESNREDQIRRLQERIREATSERDVQNIVEHVKMAADTKKCVARWNYMSFNQEKIATCLDLELKAPQ